jgi:hypothetical protein
MASRESWAFPDRAGIPRNSRPGEYSMITRTPFLVTRADHSAGSRRKVQQGRDARCSTAPQSRMLPPGAHALCRRAFRPAPSGRSRCPPIWRRLSWVTRRLAGCPKRSCAARRRDRLCRVCARTAGASLCGHSTPAGSSSGIAMGWLLMSPRQSIVWRI